MMTTFEFDELLDQIMDSDKPHWADLVNAIAQRLETRASALRMLGEPQAEDYQTLARHLLITSELSAFQRAIDLRNE